MPGEVSDSVAEAMSLNALAIKLLLDHKLGVLHDFGDLLGGVSIREHRLDRVEQADSLR